VFSRYYATDLHDAWSRYCPPPRESPLLGAEKCACPSPQRRADHLFRSGELESVMVGRLRRVPADASPAFATASGPFAALLDHVGWRPSGKREAAAPEFPPELACGRAEPAHPAAPTANQ
jgi:hypothetical protein